MASQRPTWVRVAWNIIAEVLAHSAIGVSIFLLCFGAWTWAQDNYVLQLELSKDITRLQVKMENVERRVTSIEDRLFSIFMMAGGAVIGSGVSSFFSILIHRRLRNGEGK